MEKKEISLGMTVAILRFPCISYSRSPTVDHFGTYQPYCNYKCNLFTSYLIQFFPVHNRERTCSDEDKINKDKKKKNRTFAFLIRNCDTTFEVSFACYAEDTVQKNILYKSSLCF